MIEILKGIDVADVYAAALFALAQEGQRIDEFGDELRELAELHEREPGFATFMTSSAVDTDTRRKSLERMFRRRLSDQVLNTLHVMNEHGRAGLVPQLSRAYALRVEDARGQIEVTATSAVELDAAQRAEVARVAERLARKQPLVEYVVDPGLIGGLVLEIGDHRFDYSVRRQLRAAQARLRERAERGLPIGAEP
jgi:F-type H+-transporting ATPase subunit delta